MHSSTMNSDETNEKAFASMRGAGREGLESILLCFRDEQAVGLESE